MGEEERDGEVIEALDPVACQSAQVPHDLHDRHHLDPLEGEAARHDHPDVAGAEDHNSVPDHDVLSVDEALCRPGGIDARGPAAGNLDLGAGTLPTPHGEHDARRLHLHHAQPLVGAGETGALGVQDHRVEQEGDALFRRFLIEAGRILGTGQLLIKIGKPKTRVDALLQDSSQ